MARRPLLACCVLLASLGLAAWCSGAVAFVTAPTARSQTTGLRGSAVAADGYKVSRAASRRSFDDDENVLPDSVELRGYSALLVGLVFLPYIVYTLVVAFGVVAQGEKFVTGPYGLEALACAVTVGIVIWSIGSFVTRGKGLPAGPLGLLGASEGLAYLGTLGLTVALVSGKAVQLPDLQAPSMPTPPTIAEKKPEEKKPEAPKPAEKKLEEKKPAEKKPEAPKPAETKAEAPKPAEKKAEAPAMPAMPANPFKDFKAPALPSVSDLREDMKDLKMPGDIKMPANPFAKTEEKKSEEKKPEEKKPEAPKPAEKKAEVKNPEEKKPEAPKPAEKKAEAPKAGKATSLNADFPDYFD